MAARRADQHDSHSSSVSRACPGCGTASAGAGETPDVAAVLLRLVRDAADEHEAEPRRGARVERAAEGDELRPAGEPRAGDRDHGVDLRAEHHGIGHGQHRRHVDEDDVGAAAQLAQELGHRAAVEQLGRVAGDRPGRQHLEQAAAASASRSSRVERDGRG